MKWKDDLAVKIQQRQLKNDTFTIISNDCWGAEAYRHFGLAYRTPFVGLFVMAPCFIKLLKDLPFYMNTELTFVKQSKYEERNIDRHNKNKFYPIALLSNDIEIHFLHYPSDDEAYKTWNKRKQRINWDNLYIKFDSSKDGCNYELLKEFDGLPFEKKLCLSHQKFPEITSCIQFDNWVVDGAKMYRISLEKVNMINWLNGGSWKQTSLFYSLFYTFFIRNNKAFL